MMCKAMMGRQVINAPETRMPQQHPTLRLMRASVLAIACMFSLASPASKAQTTAQTPPEPAQSSGGPEQLHLLVGRSLIITSPGRIKRVSVADPSIAEAIVVTPYQILLNGKAPGGVSLLIWDENDQSQAFEVSVDIDVLSLSEKIHEVFPSEPVVVESSKDSVMLSGKISSAAVADKILEVVKNATPKVTSLMQVPPPITGEILLEVKFAEVDKSALQQLGVNLLFPGGSTLGQVSTQQFSPPIIQGQIGTLGGGASTSTPTTGTGTPTTTTTFGLSNLLNIFLYNPSMNVGATIQALQTNDVLQILAEPNVLTVSGKEASFLAGGEFPYPVVQSTGGGTFPTISIQFKEFGVKLNFTPTIMPDGSIHLKVTPEVSALDFTNALTISGFTIPALSTRRVTSEMDLQDGQSFAIAGLMDNRVTEQFSKIPWIGDVPVLGKLFQSRSLQKTKDELLVVVTPRIVHPLAANQVPPGPTFPISFLPGPTTPQTFLPPITK
jgi:pilus assembly protein CpaC